MEIIVCMIVNAAAVIRVATRKYYIHTTPPPHPIAVLYNNTSLVNCNKPIFNQHVSNVIHVYIKLCVHTKNHYVVINPFSLNLKLLSSVMDHVTVLFVGIYIFEYVNFNNIGIVIVIIVLSVLYDYEHLHVAWCYCTVRS